MILISHRGNISGPNQSLENHPDYILTALKGGFDVEIDFWCLKKKLFLGHDYPQYPIKKNFLKGSIFPVEEGVILYVRDSKVWKSGTGRGMVVTHRAVVVGNQNFKEDGTFGIIMSFTGQVPTYVEGVVEDGDLLVPAENTNHCIAVSPDKISFSDYRRAVGTAWGKRLTSEVGLVNCAIGIK